MTEKATEIDRLSLLAHKEQGNFKYVKCFKEEVELDLNLLIILINNLNYVYYFVIIILMNIFNDLT